MKQIISSLWIIMILLVGGCAQTERSAALSRQDTLVIAKAAFDAQQYQKAKVLFEQVLQQDPSVGDAALMLARTEYQLDQKQAAKTRLQSLIDERNSQTPHAAYYLGKFLLDDGDNHTALQVYRNGLLYQPLTLNQQALLHNGYGVALMGNSDFLLAQQQFIAAIQAAPDVADYRANLALAWLMQGKLTQARQEFTPLLSYKNLPPHVEMNYALLLLAENNDLEAKVILSRHLSPSQVENDIYHLKSQLTATLARYQE